MRQMLRDIADIQIGYPFRGRVKPDSNGTHFVIQIKDIDKSQHLCIDDLDKVIPPGAPPDKYQVRDGDVLFLSRGHRNFAIPVHDPPDYTIVASYFYILRPKTSEVLPGYMAWWINQEPAQSYLRSVSGGSHMPIVRRAEFELLEIQIPNVETQQTIIQLDELLCREQYLLSEIDKRRKLLAEYHHRTMRQACLKAASQQND